MPATETLAARAEAMLIRLAEVKADAASQQARTEIEAARARASKIAADTCAANSAVPVMHECGIAVDLAVHGALLQETARARTVLRTAATSMVGAQPDEVANRAGSQSIDTALAIAERLNRSVLAGLNRSVERWRQEILPVGIAERIVAYPGTSDALVVRLGNIQRRLQQKVENQAAEQLAQRAQQINSDAATWVQERPQLDTGLEGSHPDVQEFLRQAATDEGASWHLITTAVAAWLENPENTASLRVVLRS
jgi:hypothetical protein